MGAACVSELNNSKTNSPRFLVQLTLVKPNVRGLEEDDVGPAPEEESGVDYSSPWHDNYVACKAEIKQNLHILHPSMPTVLQMCEATLGHMLLVDCSEYR